MRHIGHVHVHGAWDVACHPLVLVAHVDHGHGLRAQHPLRHVLHIDGLKRRHVAAARPPRVDAAVQVTRDGVVPDAQQLSLRLAQIPVSGADQHEGTATGDEPSHPRADRTVDADAVAARDVAAVVIAPCAHVHHRRALLHAARHLAGGQPGQRGQRAAEQRRACLVDRRHVPVVGRVPVLVQGQGQEGHHLGRPEERVRLAFVTQRGLVPGAAASAAERPAAVRWEDSDVVGQPAQTDLQRAQRFEREMDGEMRAEEVGPRDRPEHDRPA
jgi:hypothetical protein